MTHGNEPTPLEFAILALLALAPRSGYDLLNEFATTAIGTFSSSPGAIYPALRRLEKRGLVGGTVNASQPLRPKKIFKPTPEGGEILRSWLRRAITTDDIRRHLDELLLRFAFHSLLEARASRDFLRDLAEKVDEYLAELKGQRKLFPHDAPPQGRMAFELGIEHYRACARWARRMFRQFEEAAT